MCSVSFKIQLELLWNGKMTKRAPKSSCTTATTKFKDSNSWKYLWVMRLHGKNNSTVPFKAYPLVLRFIGKAAPSTHKVNFILTLFTNSKLMKFPIYFVFSFLGHSPVTHSTVISAMFANNSNGNSRIFMNNFLIRANNGAPNIN